MRLAINGFGRIGRTATKIALKKKDIELVAINDLTDTKTLAHLFKYDSQYHTYPKTVTSDTEHLIVDGQKIKVFAEKEPSKLPWDELKIDVVLECTGRFTDKEGASGHITAGARKVIISAPPKDKVGTFVIGVNEEKAHEDEVISNASCTTNCIAPVMAVIHQHFGIVKAMMTTVHSYTADQNLQDGPHKDLRRARSAAVNIVPTTTGAAISTAEVIPDLKGIFDGLSIRVPTQVVSLSDFAILLKKNTTIEEVNKVIRQATDHPRYKGIIEVTDEPLVSSDFIGNPASTIVDLSLTNVIDGDFLKVVAWYDNEYGYSNRLVEMAQVVDRS